MQCHRNCILGSCWDDVEMTRNYVSTRIVCHQMCISVGARRTKTASSEATLSEVGLGMGGSVGLGPSGSDYDDGISIGT